MNLLHRNHIAAVLLLFILTVLPLSAAHAVVVEASGSSLLVNGDLRRANTNALSNALSNAISGYISSNLNQFNLSEAPVISGEYFRFVRGYQILSRKVAGNAVHYSLRVNIDESGLGDAQFYVSNTTESSVFVVTGYGTYMTEEEANAITAQALAARQFSTAKQAEFTAHLAGSTVEQAIVKAYQDTGAMLLVSLKTDISKKGNSCTLTLQTKLYRSGTPTTMKTTMKGNDDTGTCVTTAYRAALDSTLDYIRSNVVKKQEQMQKHSFKVTAINYQSASNVNAFLSMLKGRKYFDEMNVTSFTNTEMQLDVSSVFTQKQLLDKLRGFEMQYGFIASDQGGSVQLDFSPGAANN